MELLHLLIVTFLFIGPWTIYFPTDSISLRYLQILKDISFYAYVMESVLVCNLVDHNQVCAGRQIQGLEVSILLGNIVGSAEHKVRSSCLRMKKKPNLVRPIILMLATGHVVSFS